MSRTTRRRSAFLGLAWGAVVAVASGQDRQAAGAEVNTRPGFVILDDTTTRPVAGASVRVLDPFGYDDDCVSVSDAAGRAGLLREWTIGKVVNEPAGGNRLKVLGWRVKVEAKDYHQSTTPLVEHTGNFIDLGNLRVEQPVIRLRSVKVAPATEIYIRHESFTTVNLLLNEDRFDAVQACPKLCSEHTPWFEAKYGTVTRDGDRVVLKVLGQERIRRANGVENWWLPETYLRVDWGQRRYLVAEEQMLAFCNAVNQGEEPRDSEFGDFFLGEGQEAIAAKDLPKLPEPWSSYLLRAPVKGVVTAVLPGLRATVNIGRKHGLRPGMVLVATQEPRFSDQVVESVQTETATVTTRNDPDDTYWKIQVGDVVSTRRPPRDDPAEKTP